MILTYGAPDIYCVRCASPLVERLERYRGKCERWVYDVPRDPRDMLRIHFCSTPWTNDLERRRNPSLRLPINSFGHIVYDPEFFRPQMAACPDCGADVGQPCLNRGVKLPKPTKHAHKARNFAALAVRGLRLTGARGEWRIYEINRRYIRRSNYYPAPVVIYPEGTLTCENI